MRREATAQKTMKAHEALKNLRNFSFASSTQRQAFCLPRLPTFHQLNSRRKKTRHFLIAKLLERVETGGKFCLNKASRARVNEFSTSKKTLASLIDGRKS